MYLRHAVIAHGKRAEVERVHCQHMQDPRLFRRQIGSIHGQGFVDILLICEAQLPYYELIVSSMPDLSRMNQPQSWIVIGEMCDSRDYPVMTPGAKP